MRVLFYARPWTTAIQLAVEEHWRAAGMALEARYVTHQVQAFRELRAAGREVAFIPAEVRAIAVEDPDRELADFERRHAGRLEPLMRYAMAERYFHDRDREWQRREVARHALWLERLLDGWRPRLLVGDAPDLMPVWLAHGLAPSYGCRPVGLMPSTLPPGRLLLLQGHDTIPGAREHYEEIRARGASAAEEAAAHALQATITGTGTKLDYVHGRRVIDFARRFLTGRVLGEHVAGSLVQMRERKSGNWFVQPDPILWRIRQAAHLMRGRVADRVYLRDPAPAGPYVFYPLHFEPEATTLVNGSWFENQAELVRNIARALPAGWLLVVKEHFWMRNQRTLGFYRRLARIPNVVLVPFAVPTNRLIMEARALATIVSTAGLEAGLIGKPVVMFGDYAWDYGPTIHKVGALADLPALIARAAESALPADHPDVIAFGASWDAALPPGRYYTTRQYDWTEPENVRLVADALQRAAEDAPVAPVPAA
jgi:hypothetical protein